MRKLGGIYFFFSKFPAKIYEISYYFRNVCRELSNDRLSKKALEDNLKMSFDGVLIKGPI